MMETEDDVQLNIENLKSAIFNVQKEVKSNAYNYDGYVKLISLLSNLHSVYKSQELKTSGNEKQAAENQTLIAFNKLRNARKSMAAVYPLSVELWTQWFEDELNPPNASTSIDHSIIEDIFSKASLDYLSVDIWCIYGKYLISRQKSGEVTVTSVREMFEKGVLNCGLHYQDGHKIWEAYQQFEQKLLLEAEIKLKEDSTPENIENFKTLLLNVIKVFKRQMHIPLAKTNELLTRFTNTIDPFIEVLKLFTSETQLFKIEEMKNILADTAKKIEAESIAVQENCLEECQHSLEAYQSYVSHELDAGTNDPARVQCLFERTIVYHCLKPSVWLDYIDFLNNTLKQSDLALATCKRALRNVTWDFRIYVKYAVILEQNISEPDEIRSTYEMGLEKYSENGINYCSVWMSYLSFEKRICDSKTSLIKKKPQIYQLIKKALHQFEGMAEPDKFIVEFIIFWMNIEKFWFDDETKPEIILKYFGIKYRYDYSLWYQVVTFARAIGYKDLVNELFNIGLAEFPDSFEQIGQSWINFENIFGTLNSCNHLEKKINIHIPFRLQSRKKKECMSIKSKTEHQNKFVIAWLNRAEKQLFSTEEQSNSLHPVSDESSVKRFSGPLKNKIDHSHKAKANGGDKMDDEDKERKDPVKRKHGDATTESENSAVIGPVMPPGFVQSNNDHAIDSDDDDDSDEDLMPPPKKLKFTEKSLAKKKISGSEDDEYKRTVYVSNLHPATSENDLNIIFGRAGDVQKVNLQKHKGGKIYAFVTFSKPEEAQNAFELEHTPIRNRPVFVSKFNRSQERHTAAATHSHYSQQQEKNKLFVSNLDKFTTQSDLEKLFNRHGDMASLRLINKKGAKPFAYVDYKTEDDAARYRNEVNNAIVKGRQIVVEFSNPGRGNQTDRQRQLIIGTSSYHGPKVEQKKTDDIMEDTSTEKPTETMSDASVVNKSTKKPLPAPFGLIPMQARNPRNLQPTARKPKVRISVTPVSSSSNNDNLPAVPEESVSSDDKIQTPNESASASKSNDEFRKLLLNKE